MARNSETGRRDYRRNWYRFVLIPFVVTRHRLLEIALSMAIPTLSLWGLVALNRALYP